MYTPFKMKGKSPMMKKLIGNQNRLPEHLKAKIEAGIGIIHLTLLNNWRVQGNSFHESYV